MGRSRGSLLGKILPFVVAALYAGIIAYIAMGIAKQARLELQRARAKKQPAWPELVRLLQGRK